MSKFVTTKEINNILVRETDNNIIEVISNGKQGVPGKSAYEVAVLNGFNGTEEEWLASLKGEAFTYDDFTNEQLAQLVGPQGKSGYYYIPSVSKEGILTWTNSGNLINPEPISIKGPQGIKGEQGNIGPIGETGPKGDKGNSATIRVGEVITGDENSNVIVTNSGTNTDAILNFTIPKGVKGDKGDIGPQGPKGDTGSQGIQGLKGDKGDVGEPFRITKVYASIGDMNADYNNEEVNIGNFVIIETGNVDHPDNSKLYVKTDSGYSFITDLSGSQGITGPQGPKGDKGEIGYYFTPNVDSNGLLSWTNNGNLLNPDSVNIKGPQGIQGPIGPKGDIGLTGNTGPKGESAIISAINATIDSNVGTPSVTVDLGGTELNRTFTFNFKNIKGEQGIQGIQGIQGEKGNPFVYSDFTQEQLESLRGPKGDTGEKGDQGLKGDSGINATITNVTASIDSNIGTPSVTVSMGGTSSARTFNFDFKNLKGSKGDTGEKGLKGDTGISVTNAEINFNNGHLILTLE